MLPSAVDCDDGHVAGGGVGYWNFFGTSAHGGLSLAAVGVLIGTARDPPKMHNSGKTRTANKTQIDQSRHCHSSRRHQGQVAVMANRHLADHSRYCSWVGQYRRRNGGRRSLGFGGCSRGSLGTAIIIPLEMQASIAPQDGRCNTLRGSQPHVATFRLRAIARPDDDRAAVERAGGRCPSYSGATLAKAARHHHRWLGE